jgi:hypothetical protein
MKVDAYFKNMNDAIEYSKKNSNKLIVVDERKEEDLFGTNKKNCLFEKAKEECKCGGCERRRNLEMQLVLAKINMVVWDCIAEAIEDNKDKKLVKKQGGENK